MHLLEKVGVLMEEKEFYIGVLCFNEQLGMDLIEKLNQTDEIEDISGQRWKIKAEHIFIHEVEIGYKSKYKIILDRRSHVLKHARGIMMRYAYSGIHVINNPMSFYYFMHNKDFGFSMMDELGVNIPRTFILPPYITPLTSPEDFRYHLEINWDKIASDIGFPCYIKPAAGRGAINVNKASSLEELRYFYTQSGEEIMTVQKAVKSPYNWQVRCICIGRHISPIKYIFKPRDRSEYIFDEHFLSPETMRLIIDTSKLINRALGYEMNSVEFIIDEQGVPWAIDFNNPVPDGRRKALGEVFYMDFLDALYKHILYIVKFKPPYSFLPDLNLFSEIARSPLAREEKFQKALTLATEYYIET